VLNRLYIVIGVIAILVLAAAFIVPSFVPWGNYRARLQTLAGDALGAEVRINGDIRFSLLPQPHIEVTDVSVGPVKAPVMSVKSADADLSLLDFLRDRYSVTKLILDQPVLGLLVNADGSVTSGLHPASGDSKSSLSIANARIIAGSLRVNDSRSGEVYALEGLEGDLPFGFEGSGSFGSSHLGLRLTSAAIDAAGNAQIALFVHPDDNAFSINADGTLTTGAQPHFTGNLNYRQSPAGGSGNGVIGDLTLTGKIDANAAQMALGDLVLIPDENRAVTRLAGSVTFDFGATPHFAAIITSDLLSLPPRDATKEQGPQPYELVRQLGELPVVPVPPMVGTVSATVSQLDLRSFTLSDVRLAAQTDGKLWAVKEASGRLPGNTRIVLAGNLDDPDGRPSFSGTLGISAARLDTLSTLWRKPADGNPLFDLPGSFRSKLVVLGQTVALTDGQLTLGGAPHALTALINFGEKRRVDLSGQFTDLTAEDSAALLALAPDLQQDPSAAVTFPQGAVALSAETATLFGLKGRGLALEGKWANGAVELSKFSAADLGGAAFDLTLALGGTAAEPHIAGDGSVSMGADGGPALALILDTLGAPPAVRTVFGRSLPAELKLHLDDPKDGGEQGVSISGKAGAADVTLVAQLSGGVLKALTAPLTANLDVDAASAKDLTAQLGLGDVSLLPETGPAKLTASVDGTPAATLKATLVATGGGDSASFDGLVTAGDMTAMSGSGKLAVSLSDTSVMAAAMGLGGLYAPPVKGSATLQFVAGRSLSLDDIAGNSGAAGFSGKLSLNQSGRGGVISGGLTLDAIEIGSLVAVAGGPTALMMSAGKSWPDGPLSVGDAPRTTTGSIAIATPSLLLGGVPVAGKVKVDLDWDATSLSLHNLMAQLGGGTASGDISLCCAGQLADKELTGQAALRGVALQSILPAGTAASVDGAIDASARFGGTGDSVEALLDGLSGDGSFSVKHLSVAKFDPEVFASVAALGNIVDIDPADLATRVATGLDQGPFAIPALSGGFTLAGGTLRAPNIATSTTASKLFGGLTVKLDDLSLGGAFSLTPVGTVDKAGLVTEATSKVTANLGGTLALPTRTLDIASMVDAIKVRALEVEVARLESLKEADDARARANDIARKLAREDRAAQQLADALAAEVAARQAAADKAAADAAAAQAAADKAAAAKVAADARAAEKAAADKAAAAKAKAAADKAAVAAASKPPAPFELIPPASGSEQFQ
jgi:hypothetical protein